ncbi:MAG TPA: hypothetical protein VEY69_12855 [Lautropia sp.]|nr:hypothetical protein [Lautropia sp.]
MLAERLTEKERELAAHFESMRLIDWRNASATERQRIMQDMHDGLGAQLVPWLVMVERGGAKPADIAMLLRESLDEMRLAIDAFGQAETDLNGALAGLHPGWSVGSSPPGWRSNGAWTTPSTRCSWTSERRCNCCALSRKSSPTSSSTAGQPPQRSLRG